MVLILSVKMKQKQILRLEICLLSLCPRTLAVKMPIMWKRTLGKFAKRMLVVRILKTERMAIEAKDGEESTFVTCQGQVSLFSETHVG